MPGPENSGAGGRKFYRERYAIKMTANRGNRRQIVSVGREIGVQCPRPGDEERDGAVPENIAGVFRVLWRHLERRYPVDVLAPDPKNLAARRQHSRVRTKTHDRLGECGRRVDNVLAIVEDEQELLRSDGPSDGFVGNRVLAKLEPQNSRHRGGHKAWIGEGRQFDKPTASSLSREELAGNIESKRTLADPTGSSQCDDTIGRQKSQQMLCGSFSADQLRRWQR